MKNKGNFYKFNVDIHFVLLRIVKSAGGHLEKVLKDN